MSITIDGIRIADLPVLGNFTSDSSLVGEHLGSGLFTAGALGNYFATTGTFVPAINPITNTNGMLGFPSTDIYQSPDSYALAGSMTIRGQPYGYYDTGTLLSLVATTEPLSSSRAGVNGGFENGVSAIAAYGSMDSVSLYVGAGSAQPPLVLHNVTYDASHIFPQTPLTTAQMKVLRKNMWVSTNSIDTTVNPAPATPHGYLPETHYSSYVTGWATDGTSISVVGWTVPGSGHTAAGQVPSSTLDPGSGGKAAYFGSPYAVFGGNFVLQINPTAYPDSRTRGAQGIEFDFWNYSTVDYAVGIAGVTIGHQAFGGAKLAQDSYGLNVQGIPIGVKIGADVGIYISADVTAIEAFVLNAYTEASPAVWAGSPTTNLTWETQNYIDNNILRLQCWASRDFNGSGGWPDASVHLGLRVDGTPNTMTGGTLFSQIVWNPHAYESGMQLMTGAGVAGLTMDSNGFVIPHVVNAANDAAAASAGVPIGAMYRNGSVAMVRVA